jgi:hypothetical protein
MFYEGERYVDAVGSLSFTKKVTEQYAVDSFIELEAAQYPNLKTWGMQKITK